MPKKIDKNDIVGKKYGRLIVMKYAYEKNYYHYYHCKCDCGNMVIALRSHLVDGSTQSCGCLQSEIQHVIGKSKTGKNNPNYGKFGKDHSQYKHGDSNTRLYNIWKNMRQRCRDPNTDNYKYYGGKGIKVCDEWSKYSNFKNWALTNGYTDSLTIDRIKSNGNYEPTNCQWISNFENLSKKEMGKYNHLIDKIMELYNKGESKVSISKKIGIPRSSIYYIILRESR
jgi:hypothetical protein